MNDLNNFEKILNKYNLETPLPSDVKKRMLESKKSIFISSLKKTKKYSFFIFISVSLYFWLNKIGITISLFKTAIVTFFLMITTASIITGSAALIVKKYYFNKNDTENKISHQTQSTQSVLSNEKNKVVTSNSAKKINKKKTALNYKIEIIPFSNETENARLSTIIPKKISVYLNNFGGLNTSRLNLTQEKNKIKNDLLTGTITKLNGKYIIFVKIINYLNAELKYYFSSKPVNEEEIDNACNEIAKKILKKIK